jgi:hypothetical protein
MRAPQQQSDTSEVIVNQGAKPVQRTGVHRRCGV